MSFVYPQLFWVLLVPFVVFAVLVSTNKEKISRIFDEKVLRRLSGADESVPQVVRNITLFFAIFLMIVAMARPVLEKGEKVVEVKGLSLLAGLDISGSMRSKDQYPNRLEFAKKKMALLFDTMPSDEISVLAFAYSSFVLAPFTSDKETLKMMVEGVDDSYINMGSTDFMALGALTANLLKDKKPKIVVLFTDGGDKEAIANVGALLKENDITLFVVLVGTLQGAPVIGEEGKPFTKKDGTIAITQRNDALGEVAKESGGAYVVATNGKEDIEELVSVIRSKYKNQQQGEVKMKERVEFFYYPLAMGLLLFLIALSSVPRPVRYKEAKSKKVER